MASFAKAQLLKYGWTEGKGLGKHENGIVDALRPKLKFDTSGVGHDSREHKWWESVYDKAASNVNVNTDSSNVTLSVKDKDAVEITTRKVDIKKLRKKHNMEYGSFLKTSTLENGKMLPDENLRGSALDEVLHEAPVPELTDEQLFEACGGRTAHKGARHGLTLSGKLARIAQQEAELLGLTSTTTATDDWTVVKRKKELKRKRRRSAAEIDLEVCNGNKAPEADSFANAVCRAFLPAEPTEERKKSKTAKRREKRKVEDLVNKLNSVVIVDDSRMGSRGENCQSSKRWMKMKRKCCEIDDTDGNDNKVKKRSVVPLIELVDEMDKKLANIAHAEREAVAREHKREFTEADRLNNRIEKKKKKKRQTKTEKRRVERLSESLMAVNLCEDSVDSGRGEDLIESCETSRKLKKWKKHKKEKRDKKIEEIVLD